MSDYIVLEKYNGPNWEFGLLRGMGCMLYVRQVRPNFLGHTETVTFKPLKSANLQYRHRIRELNNYSTFCVAAAQKQPFRPKFFFDNM